jgi:hypothetical protein
VSWNPAVPPPPAAGAPLGIGAGEEVGVADGAGAGVENSVEGLTDGLGLEVVPGVVVAVAVAVAVVPLPGLVVGAPPLTVPLGEVVTPIEPDTVTEGMVGVEVELPPEHAEIAVEARMVSAPAPISLALSVIPAMVVRSFIGPSSAAICDGLFPGSGFTNPHLR